MSQTWMTAQDAMRRVFVVPMALCLILLAAPRASAAEHPGILDRQDTCSTCHADKFKGKSVHSAMSIPCTVCHVAQTRGDMTTMDLLMPKEQICFACHTKSSESQDHKPPVKGVCLGCHDAHASNRPALLRDQADSATRLKVTAAKSATRRR